MATREHLWITDHTLPHLNSPGRSEVLRVMHQQLVQILAEWLRSARLVVLDFSCERRSLRGVFA